MKTLLIIAIAAYGTGVLLLSLLFKETSTPAPASSPAAKVMPASLPDDDDEQSPAT
jgi:hypothetical protein